MNLVHKNFKEDFKVLVNLGTAYDGEAFLLIFYVGRNMADKFVCSYDGDETYKNCVKVDDSNVLCLFDNHGLGCGILNLEIHRKVVDSQMPDGYLDLVSNSQVICTDENGATYGIELYRGVSENTEITETTLLLLADIIKGDPGEGIGSAPQDGKTYGVKNGEWTEVTGGTGVVDEKMSDESTNAVQNKVIKAYADAIGNKIPTKTSQLTNDGNGGSTQTRSVYCHTSSSYGYLSDPITLSAGQTIKGEGNIKGFLINGTPTYSQTYNAVSSTNVYVIGISVSNQNVTITSTNKYVLNTELTYIQTAINGKADKATTLSGYGITDAYTQNEVNILVNEKENALVNITDGTLIDVAQKKNITSLYTPAELAAMWQAGKKFSAFGSVLLATEFTTDEQGNVTKIWFSCAPYTFAVFSDNSINFGDSYLPESTIYNAISKEETRATNAEAALKDSDAINYDSTKEEHTAGSVGAKLADLELEVSDIKDEIGDVETLINAL